MRISKVGLIVCLAACWPVVAFAHCDTLDGPVVQAARQALASGDVKSALMWVKPDHEHEIQQVFDKAMAVRKLGVEAKNLADTFFYETLVRLHRLGEGAPYTGLKPAGHKVDPAIAAVDEAIETGSIESLSKTLGDELAKGLEMRFKSLLVLKKSAEKNVDAGREFVAAYVELTHYAEAIHNAVAGRQKGHGAESAEHGGHAE